MARRALRCWRLLTTSRVTASVEEGTAPLCLWAWVKISVQPLRRTAFRVAALALSSLLRARPVAGRDEAERAFAAQRLV
ncbi:MAG: hypothetical protein AMK72_00445 [Planctomycetes bacterium SM23_25]|nr:MAG: hypothetical protein AMK72_00445 [Planctomycetes bacterium SM23_25]